jgi:uncharacterized protein YkwD
MVKPTVHLFIYSALLAGAAAFAGHSIGTGQGQQKWVADPYASPNPEEYPDDDEEILRLVNKVRARATLPAFTLNSTLNKMARDQACAQMEKNNSSNKPEIDHDNLPTRAKNAGVNGYVSEIMAVAPTADAVVEGWKQSSDHNRIMHLPGLRDLGVGTCVDPANHLKYWVGVVKRK